MLGSALTAAALAAIALRHGRPWAFVVTAAVAALTVWVPGARTAAAAVAVIVIVDDLIRTTTKRRRVGNLVRGSGRTSTSSKHCARC